jgi:MFS family permease
VAVAGASRRDRLRLGFAAAAVLLAAADTYVVVVALPSIMAGVGVGLDRLQRAAPIISGFLLGYTAALPLIGRLADLAGEGPVLGGCLAAFASGSVVTATSHSLPVAVAGRALQGLGGGGMVPVTLAIVAKRWPPDARGLPLGVIGALQELGSVLGPLYGAAVVSVASWRAIFWINVPVVAVVGAGVWATNRRSGLATQGGATRFDSIGAGLALLGGAGLIVGLDAPARLAGNASIGQLYAPEAAGPWAAFTTPLVLASLGVLAVFVAWELVAPHAGRLRRVRPAVRFAEAFHVVSRADLPGAALFAGVLACVVTLFSTADPSRQVVASSAPFVAPLGAALAVAFVVRQRRAADPLVAPGAFAARPAWGALAVNAALGAALMAALVDVPLFARATVDPFSEVSAALVLVRFLVAVPVGALLGGALCRRRSLAPWVAGAGMMLAVVTFATMTSWGPTALGGGPRPSDAELVVCGLGFGLAVAPVNVAVLGAVRPGVHALASALAVVARTVGMLAGLSALTAIGLRRFYEAQARIGSPLTLCPRSPANCPPYETATTSALLAELHTLFGGAAVCAGLAGVLAVVLLRPRHRDTPARAEVTAGGGDTTR